MPINLKTQVAQTAVSRGALSPGAAATVEKLAEATKDVADGFKALGLSTDAYATAANSPAVQALSPRERELLSHVYAEMLGNVSGGLAALAGGPPSPTTVKAAYEEVTNILEHMQAAARAHGPGVTHVPRNGPDFRLADYPEALLQHGYRVKGDVGADPHILVTFRSDGLEDNATHYNIGKRDLTPEAFVEALRVQLKGAFPNVELRARDEDGDRVAVSPAAGATPAAPAETTQQKFQRAAAELKADLDNIPALAGRVSDVFQHTAELSPCLAVRTNIAEGSAFSTLKPELEKAVAAWLDDKGFSDLVSRNYLANTIMIVAKDGGLPL